MNTEEKVNGAISKRRRKYRDDARRLTIPGLFSSYTDRSYARLSPFPDIQIESANAARGNGRFPSQNKLTY